MSLKIHYLILDEKGPIISGGMTLNTPQGAAEVGKSGRWRAACDAKILLNDQHRGTGDPWAVRCAACKKTEAFKKDDRPKPGTQSNDLVVAPEDCC